MRTAKGLSQEEFGDRAGINWKYYSQIERGEKNITFKTLEQILATGHQLPLPNFFAGYNEEKRKPQNDRLIALFHRFLKTATRREKEAVSAFFFTF
jgi:transcriptional regulator with XRE-family HTH domain